MVVAETGARLYREQLDRPPSLADGLRCLAGTPQPFALVGAWAGGGALLGCAPVRTAGADEDPFELLANAAGETDAGIGVGGGWVGYLGYELRMRAEHAQPSPPRSGGVPPFALAYYDHVIRCDAAGAWWFEALWSDERAALLAERLAWWRARIASPPAPQPARTSAWRLSPSPAAHAELVAACRERIHAGDLYQANVCAELEGRFEGSALELFIRGVSALAPDRAAYLGGAWGAVVSLSPELFLERHGRQVRTAPIKGTRPRPRDPQLAGAQRLALEGSAKDRAENVMIVDLMRNDLGRVCEPGSIAVDALAAVEPHAGVWHMVSEVHGTLRPELDDAALLAATFPPGSVTGAPKLAAMNVIAELESRARGVYTGAIGIASPLGGLELNVAIRTFEVADGRIRLGVGGGVVADSQTQSETAELAVKATPLLEAIGAVLEPDPRANPPGPRVRRLGPLPVPRPDPSHGIFETMLVRDRRALALDAHLARLYASAGSLYRAALPDQLESRVAQAAALARLPSRLRLNARPGPDGVIEVSIELLPLSTAPSARLRTWTLPGGLGAHKWSDRRLLSELARHSCEAIPLLVDADGFILETSRHNVFALGADGVLRTPPADGRILPGLARARLLTVGEREAVETPLRVADLRAAAAVILTNALRTTLAVALDGVPLRHTPPRSGANADHVRFGELEQALAAELAADAAFVEAAEGRAIVDGAGAVVVEEAHAGA
jgi:para-aminobenzoate synthetase/4-amino-4-deoxychorismate lyase